MKFFLSVLVLTAIVFSVEVPCLLAKDTFTVIAHRGASGYLPEHTLEAKALAHGMNPDFIEQDVALTKDNVPVVIHDHYLDTVTNVASIYPERKRKDGRYYVIDFTINEIKTLTAFERIDRKTGTQVYPNRFPVNYPLSRGAIDFKIPTLSEEINLIKGLNKSRNKSIGLYVELKAPWFHRKEGRDIARVVLTVLAEHGYSQETDNIIIQCFDPLCLKKLKFIHKTTIPLVQLIADNSWNETPGVDYEAMLTPQGLQMVSRYANGIGPWIPMIVSAENKNITVSHVVPAAHKLGLIVHPYTARVDALPKGFTSMEHLLSTLYYKVKVDGIFSDFPDTAVTFREKVQSLK